ncbi:hypothetical protein KL910_001894 [Ogataea haglerorum]|nr:hypothetical protein KL910_001894 [Ogataea haglerorum]
MTIITLKGPILSAMTPGRKRPATPMALTMGKRHDKQARADKCQNPHSPSEADRRVQLVENQREHHAAHGPAEGGDGERTGPFFHEIVRHHPSKRRHQEAERRAGNDTKHKHERDHRLAFARQKEP